MQRGAARVARSRCQDPPEQRGRPGRVCACFRCKWPKRSAWAPCTLLRWRGVRARGRGGTCSSSASASSCMPRRRARGRHPPSGPCAACAGSAPLFSISNARRAVSAAPRTRPGGGGGAARARASSDLAAARMLLAGRRPRGGVAPGAALGRAGNLGTRALWALGRELCAGGAFTLPNQPAAPAGAPPGRGARARPARARLRSEKELPRRRASTSVHSRLYSARPAGVPRPSACHGAGSMPGCPDSRQLASSSDPVC